jgi:hypothetical protein
MSATELPLLRRITGLDCSMPRCRHNAYCTGRAKWERDQFYVETGCGDCQTFGFSWTEATQRLGLALRTAPPGDQVALVEAFVAAALSARSLRQEARAQSIPERLRLQIAELERAERILERNGIPTRLAPGEVQLAVVVPLTGSSELPGLGEALAAWAEGWGGAVRLLGLEPLRRGRAPEVYAGLLGLSIRPGDTSHLLERAVLVVAGEGAATHEALFASLAELLRPRADVALEDFDNYAYRRR